MDGTAGLQNVPNRGSWLGKATVALALVLVWRTMEGFDSSPKSSVDSGLGVSNVAGSSTPIAQENRSGEVEVRFENEISVDPRGSNVTCRGIENILIRLKSDDINSPAELAGRIDEQSSKQYDENGELIQKTWQFSNDKTIVFKGRFVQHLNTEVLSDGTATYNSENGMKISETEYKGLVEQSSKQYDENGNLRQETWQLGDGKIVFTGRFVEHGNTEVLSDGMEVTYDSKDKLKSTVFYENGLRTRGVTFKDGEDEGSVDNFVNSNSGRKNRRMEP